jgi:hypothetical protein
MARFLSTRRDNARWGEKPPWRGGFLEGGAPHAWESAKSGPEVQKFGEFRKFGDSALNSLSIHSVAEWATSELSALSPNFRISAAQGWLHAPVAVARDHSAWSLIWVPAFAGIRGG